MKATRTLTGLQDTPYSECLHILGLHSLQYHRLGGDIIPLHHLVNNDIGIDFGEFLQFPLSRLLEGHMYNYSSPMLPPEQDVIFFSIRAVDC